MKSQKKYYLIFIFIVLTAHTILLSSILSSSQQPLHSETSKKNNSIIKTKMIYTDFGAQQFSVEYALKSKNKDFYLNQINFGLK